MAKEHNMKSGVNRNIDSGKYDSRVSHSKAIKKGSGNINPYGDSIQKRSGISMKRGNSCTDPKSAITEHSIRIGEEYFFINQYGIFKKGFLKIKKEGIGKNRKKYVALDNRLGIRSNWNQNLKAKTLENYIVSQVSSCIKRGNGHFYTTNFNYINYDMVLEVAERDKEAATCIAGLYNGSVSEENIKTITGKIKEIVKKRQISQQQKQY